MIPDLKNYTEDARPKFKFTVGTEHGTSTKYPLRACKAFCQNYAWELFTEGTKPEKFNIVFTRENLGTDNENIKRFFNSKGLPFPVELQFVNDTGILTLPPEVYNRPYLLSLYTTFVRISEHFKYKNRYKYELIHFIKKTNFKKLQLDYVMDPPRVTEAQDTILRILRGETFESSWANYASAANAHDAGYLTLHRKLNND